MHQEYINNLLLNENCTFAPAPFLVSYVDMEAHFVSLKWNIGKSTFQISWKKKKKKKKICCDTAILINKWSGFTNIYSATPKGV